jgi:hypothetical protein
MFCNELNVCFIILEMCVSDYPSVSSYFAQIDEMQWTPYMTECLDVLSLSTESPYDEMFAHQVRLQRVAGEVESAKITMASPPPFYLSVLQTKVNDIKTKISPHLQQEGEFIITDILKGKKLSIKQYHFWPRSITQN